MSEALLLKLLDDIIDAIALLAETTHGDVSVNVLDVSIREMRDKMDKLKMHYSFDGDT